jgi:polysaccharide pyruvyl transferase WcaK-like protein
MNSKKIVGIVGAIWTSNFGDVLLAKLLKDKIESLGHEVYFLNASDAVLSELRCSSKSINVGQCDYVLFCGGGYFSEPPGNSYKWALSRYKLLFRFATECYLKRIPYSIIGVGAGPIKSFLAKAVIKHVCKHAKVVALRDKESIHAVNKLLPQLDIVQVADYVLSLKDKMDLPITKNRRFRVGIHMTVNGKAKIPAIIEYLNQVDDNYELYFVEDHPGEYERVSLIYPEVKPIFSEKVLQYKDVDTFILDINKLNYVVTSKLHVGIVAAALNKRICSLPYHAKVERLYDSFGRDDLCLAKSLSNNEISQHLMSCEKSKEVVIPDWILNNSRKIDLIIEELLSDD